MPQQCQAVWPGAFCNNGVCKCSNSAPAWYTNDGPVCLNYGKSKYLINPVHRDVCSIGSNVQIVNFKLLAFSVKEHVLLVANLLSIGIRPSTTTFTPAKLIAVFNLVRKLTIVFAAQMIVALLTTPIQSNFAVLKEV